MLTFYQTSVEVGLLCLAVIAWLTLTSVSASSPSMSWFKYALKKVSKLNIYNFCFALRIMPCQKLYWISTWLVSRWHLWVSLKLEIWLCLVPGVLPTSSDASSLHWSMSKSVTLTSNDKKPINLKIFSYLYSFSWQKI